MSVLGDELNQITKNSLGIEKTLEFLTKKFKESASKGNDYCEVKFDSSSNFSKNDFDPTDGKEIQKLQKWCKSNKISINYYYYGRDTYVFKW